MQILPVMLASLLPAAEACNVRSSCIVAWRSMIVPPASLLASSGQTWPTQTLQGQMAPSTVMCMRGMHCQRTVTGGQLQDHSLQSSMCWGHGLLSASLSMLCGGAQMRGKDIMLVRADEQSIVKGRHINCSCCSARQMDSCKLLWQCNSTELSPMPAVSTLVERLGTPPRLLIMHRTASLVVQLA